MRSSKQIMDKVSIIEQNKTAANMGFWGNAKAQLFQSFSSARSNIADLLTRTSSTYFQFAALLMQLDRGYAPNSNTELA